MGAAGPRPRPIRHTVDDMQGDDMSRDLRHRVGDENIALFGGDFGGDLGGDLGGDEDADLTALRVAIYLEDALDITLPPDLLDAAHLGTPEALATTLATTLDGLPGPA